MNRTPSGLDRRRFLTLTAAAAVAGALPARAWWPSSGAAGDSLRVTFFTDIHARTEWETPRAMAMAAAAINSRRSDLVIAGGDLITDGFQSAAETVEHRWDAYLEMHRGVNGRVEPVIGNHDLVAAVPEDGTPAATDPRARFRNAFGLERTFRTFEAAGYRFFLLDSIVVTGGEDPYEGRIDDQQLRWLVTQLASIDPSTPLVVATHIPLLTAMYQATEGATTAALANRVVVNSREVLDMFDGHNLLLVLQGHLHVDEMIRWRDTTFITGGAVCGKWWRGSWHGTPEGFGTLTLRPDRVEWQYHTYGWEALRP
jgi:3',5'-cyclic AMP phosphodiesterase CpdA